MEENSKFYWGIFLVLSSITLILLKGNILDYKEYMKDELYSKGNRRIHEFRAWAIIISFFVFGVCLLIKEYFK